MKLLGILFFSFAGIGLSFNFIKWEEGVLDCTRALLELVIYARNSVENYSMPSREILLSCDRSLLCRCGYSGERNTPESFSEFCLYCDIPDLDSRDAIEELSRDFGKSYRAQQVSRCDECIVKLRAREKELCGRLPVKKKVIVSVSVCGILMALILLL